MNSSSLIGIFGGTFDPIHNGHLQSVVSLLDELEFDQVFLLPSAIPPHRSPTHSSAKHRLKMVELAIDGYPQLQVDDRECHRTGKSYTIDTLKSFRDENPNSSLVFISGMDAYLDMPKWKQYQEYLNYAHICIMQRPGYSSELSWGDEFVCTEKEQLYKKANGSIYFAQTKLLDISSTQIRERLNADQSVQTELSQAVINYINQNQLYANI